MKTSIFQSNFENIVRISALQFLYIASGGLRWNFLGLSGDLVNNIMNKQAYRKPQEASRILPHLEIEMAVI